jgi:hypothetical protein
MQLTFSDIDSAFADYMSTADYGDLTPTNAEFEGVLYDT